MTEYAIGHDGRAYIPCGGIRDDYQVDIPCLPRGESDMPCQRLPPPVLRIPTVPESVARTVRRHMKDAELWEKDRCGCPVCRRFRKNLKMEKENARKETPQS